jgi:hypothetical protein
LCAVAFLLEAAGAFQNDEDEPFGVCGARLAKGQPSYTQDESPVGNT